MIEGIIFDCFGVLASDLWQEYVGTLTESQRQPARDLNHAYDAGLITKDEFNYQLRSVTGKIPTEAETMPEGKMNKNVELLNYISKIKPNYKIGLLSNIATNWIRDEFLTEKEQKLFNVMTLSYEVGLTKPDPKIFIIACERLGTKPQETVMIDDIEVYCEAARGIGMKAITYKNFAQMKHELDLILTAR